ncbi:serine/threonine protein kinase [Catenulispora sp. GP43]|uniref:serine/threonine-protein kinase n=1 Tax=Catenulispora sp. GP43 TaxID=3156263 RepID=UPI003511B6F5
MAGQAEPGQLVGGRYRLLARLGSGGMGRVWRASDEALRIEVAVKEVYLPAAGPDADDRLRRAEREARNAARLRDHPNVVAVHDVVVEDGVPWTVMQLVAGHTLEEHVEAFGPLSVPHATLVAGALLDALEAAHAAGIVHRDVKPANVMLADDGQVLLTDFGIAIGDTDTALTAAGSFLGSVEYIAPERARGTEGLAISDLFSLGVTLFQAVEGFSPFHRETATGTLTAVILDEAPAPVRAGRLTPLITGLLEKEPGARAGIAQARTLLAAREAAPVERTAAVDRTLAAPTAGTPYRPGTPSGRGSAVTTSRGSGTSHGPGVAHGSGTAHGTTTPRGSGGSRSSGWSGGAGGPTGSSRTAGSAGSGGPDGPGGPGGPGRQAGVPPRRPSDTGNRLSQNTDQRRRVQGQGPGPGPEQRRPTGTGQRPVPRPHNSGAPVRQPARLRPRAVILALLVLATIGGVLFATMRTSSFDVSSVKAGDFVKVDSAGHITGTLSAAKARSSADGRRVTAREDQADPDVCKKFHALGHADVETGSSVSFCLVRPLEEAGAAAPAQ